MDRSQTFLLHLGGKIEVTPKIAIKTRDDLSRVCMAIHEEPGRAHSLTIKRNTAAVVSDGSAVLGLGNIGPLAAMPVMEGKAMLFKQLAGVNAFPICLDTQDTEEIIRAIKQIAPAFGGINLEDISSPRCFEIEERLIEELDIPVFHDDQHGTAVVLLAGLLNATKLIGKPLADCKVVLCGVGAAGIACTKILLAAGVRNVIGVDKQGALTRGTAYRTKLGIGIRAYEPQQRERNVIGRDRRSGHLHRRLRSRRAEGGGREEDGERPDRVRHGETYAGDRSGRSGGVRARHGDQPFRLSESN